ncbi:hypothetical protein TWF281_005460 [Arthrobotrys megalospora]
MDPLSVAASIIAVVQLSSAVISYCVGFNLQVKGADQEISEVISELKDLQGLLNEVRAVLPDDDRPENAEVAGLYTALETSNIILVDISERLGPLLKGGFKSRLKWPFEGKVIQEKLDKLQKQKATFQLFFTLQQRKLIVDQSNDTFDLVSRAEEARRAKILNWYKTSDPEQNHKISRDHHEPQTCSWIFELESFKSWVSQDGESLWLHGIPGAGKTIICSTIIEHVKALNSPSRLVYYYFDFSDTRKQTFSSFLQSAIYQLLAVNPDIPEVATNLYEKHLGLQQSGVEELFEVFSDLVSNGKVVVIVDAIDECPKQERSDFFRVFVEKLRSKVNLLMTSRREPDIEKALGDNFTHIVSIEDSKVDEDVRIHVTNAMATHPAFKSWTSAAVKKEVLNVIVAGSRGMFRWAVCQLDVMKQCFTPRMVRAELGRMPKTLDQTYDRILQAVPDMHKTFVESALRWLAFSERPLLLNELGEAAVIDPSFGSFNADESRFLDPGKILELCGSLIVIGSKKYDNKLFGSDDWLHLKLRNEASRSMVPVEKIDEVYTTVSLSHYSVKEYLTSERLQNGPLSGYFMTAGLTHRFLTECSILYLQGLGQGQVLSQRVFDEYPLLEYCAANWMNHFGKGEMDSALRDLLIGFFDLSEPAAYINWLNAYNPDLNAPGNPESRSSWRRPVVKSVGNLVPPLYWAAQLGNIDIVTRLIDDGAEVNGPGRGFFGSPLGVASYYGFDELVKTLLENGADPNGKGGYFGNVLQAAAAGGSRKVVETLVKAGADTDKTGGAWNTALIAAATYGHDEVVSLLLKSQPDITVQSSSHGSALYQAALAGDVKTTVRLLGAGADINELGPHGTPLYAAALGGSNMNLVQTLLNRGANVNKGGKGEWGYPLIAAAKGGNVNLVRALLRAGADVNTQSDSPRSRGVSALEAAIESRNLAMFQVILDAGGDPNIQGHLYPNALYAALWTGELKMARILLERNAEITDGTFLEAISRWRQDPWFLRTILSRKPNINAHLGDKGSALHIAISTGDEEVVRLILAEDPYIDAVSSDGSVLAHAINQGMISIAKELIKKGADIHRELPEYYCPFSLSMIQGDKNAAPDFEIADTFLRLGVDVNCASRRSIGFAIDAYRAAPIRYLGERGADFNSIMEYDNCTPLQQAAMRGEMDVIEALLEFGADVNGPSGQFGTALHYATFSYGDQEAIIRLFLAKGAIVNDSGPDCGIICSSFTPQLRGLIPELIALGADVNKARRGWTPLAMAIQKGDTEIEQLLRSNGAHLKNTGAEAVKKIIRDGNIDGLEQLLADGVDPNSRKFYQSLLNEAIEEGHKNMVELLISYGASLKCLPEVHYDALTKAVEAEDQPMVEYLIQMGADPNEETTKSSWPLASAVSKGNFEVVDLLLDNGADIMLRDGSVFRNAIWGGEKMLLYLLEKVPSEDREKALDSALQRAAYLAQLDLCEQFLNMGANADFMGGYHGSPLHAVVSNTHWSDPSIYNNQKAIFKLLIEKGAKPREVEGHPSVLVSASKNLNPVFALKLLEAGANPSGRGDDEFDNPLQAAVRYEPSLIEPLIEAGADVNAVGGKFGTALHVAAYTHDCQRIAILLKHGAKLNLSSPKYGGVIQAAAKHYTIERGDWLSGQKSVRAMQLLHSRGASIHATGGNNGNALQMAAKTDNLEGIKWLLEHGADPNMKGRRGTAVEAAIEKKKWRVVSYLEQRYGRAPVDKPVSSTKG